MTSDIKPVALAPSSVAAFTEAMRGPKGALDAWLEDNNEAEVRAHVEAYARAVAEHNVKERDAEIEALRAEVELWRHKAAIHKYRRERLAEALRELVALGHPRDPAIIAARAALRDHDQEGKDG